MVCVCVVVYLTSAFLNECQNSKVTDGGLRG